MLNLIAGVVIGNVAIHMVGRGLYDVKSAVVPHNDNVNGKKITARATNLVRGVGVIAVAGAIGNVAIDMIFNDE